MQGSGMVMGTAVAEDLEMSSLSAQASEVGSAVGAGWVARYGSHRKTANGKRFILRVK